MADGLSDERLARIEPVLRRYIDDRELPGYLLSISRRGREALFLSGGLMDVERGRRFARAPHPPFRSVPASLKCAASCAARLSADCSRSRGGVVRVNRYPVRPDGALDCHRHGAANHPTSRQLSVPPFRSGLADSAATSLPTLRSSRTRPLTGPHAPVAEVGGVVRDRRPQ